MENYKVYFEQLKGEYLDTALWMESKMELNYIVLEDKENAMNEIIDMLLCAQESGRSVEATIGKSRTKFFLQYKKAILPHQNMKSILYKFIAFLVWMIIMSFFFAVVNQIEKGGNIFSQSLNLLLVIAMGLFSFIAGDYTDRLVKMKNYNQTKKVKKRSDLIRFIVQTIAIVILTLPIYILNIEWMVKFSDVALILIGLSLAMFLLAILMESILRKSDGFEEKLIQNIQKDYRKKRRDKGWDEARYIKSKKFYLLYLIPILVTVLVLELIYVLFLLAGDALNTGISAWLIFFLVLLLAVLVSCILIGLTFFNRKVLKKLMDGSIQLENDL